MKAVALSIFIAVVVVACVDCQEDELCGFLKIKCRPNQYCFKPKVPNVDLGVCFNYLGKGAVCNDDLRCDPKLECRQVDSPFIKFKICQLPSSTAAPTEPPTEAPTEQPSEAPTEQPSEAPSEQPSVAPTEQPSVAPTEQPSEAPSVEPETSAAPDF